MELRKKLAAACMLLALLLCICGCKETVDIESIESVTQVVTEAELHELKTYPNLKTLDISGSTCYPAIMKFMEDCPQVDVTYTVSIGGETISCKETQLTLEAGGFEFEELQQKLRYLPEIKELILPATTLSVQELEALRTAYPRTTLTYTVDILGTEYSEDATEVDLSALTPDGIPKMLQTLELLPGIDQAELMDGNGKSSLGTADVKVLMDAMPEVSFHYAFELFGKTLSTSDETVEYENVDIGDKGESQIRQALDILKNCSYFKLDDCGLSNEVLAKLREDYPDTKIVWRVFFGKYNILTDAEVLRAVYNVFDDTSGDLRYCTDVKYIDMGHNTELSDISFMGYMPKLEIVIVSGSAISDLSCFANCPNLEFLEIAYCSNVKDLSPLENCTKLRFLNVSFTGVENLEPLDNLPLERFVCLKPHVPYEEQQFFITFHPDCWTRFSGQDPYSLGWRYDDIGETFSEFYKKMREIFGYDKMN